MSLWEFSACVEGYTEAHGGKKDEPPSGEELDEAIARMSQSAAK